MKKTWQPPKLVVLARSKPEEAVLANCKTGGTPVGPNTVQCGKSVNCKTSLNS